MLLKITRTTLILVAISSVACRPIPSPPTLDRSVPGPMAAQIVRERLAAVVVTDRSELASWVRKNFSILEAPSDADGGSAAPISEDGYFLTADHVIARSTDRNIFIVYRSRGRMMTEKSRIVWRSAADDLALLHVSQKTPYYYEWTPPDQWLSSGHGVIHGGMATGFRSAPGKLRSSLPPENFLTGNRNFKIDIPLQPGDSGGPVVDARGGLVGINSAVEFLIPLETPIFIESEGNRPNTGKITRLIQKDRSRRAPQ